MAITLSHILMVSAFAFSFWFLNGRAWTWDGVKWSKVLNNIWRYNIPKHDQKCRMSALGLPGGFMKASKDGMQAEPRSLDEWIEILVKDRYAVAQANEIMRAEVSAMPFRFQLWLAYQIQILGQSIEEISKRRGIPVPVLSYFAWRFGMMDAPWTGMRPRQWLDVPGFAVQTMMRSVKRVVGDV